MISVVCVYNNEGMLNRILLPSLKEQTVKYQLILMRNVDGRFKSAASALNYGAQMATGKYIMFVHQDIELGSKTWLADVERTLDTIPDLGIAGVLGVVLEGKSYLDRSRGLICNCGKDFGNPITKPERVQTLDEVVAVIPRTVFQVLQFDARNFDGWHLYVADYCLSTDHGSYVVPNYVYHRSLTTNSKDIWKYRRRLLLKHRRKIVTTGGRITWANTVTSPFYRLLWSTYKSIFPVWPDIVRRETRGYVSALDLGCGYDSQISVCKIPYTVGVEIFEPYLTESSKKGIHNLYIKKDILDLNLPPKSFDVVVASEVLEHISKEEGLTLLSKMEEWAKRKVILTTPNGYVWQDGYDSNPYQEHKSGWTVDELRSKGYRVYGQNGLKFLRGYRGIPIYKPVFLWNRISDVTQKVTKYFPKMAFQLLAVKEIK